MGCFIPPFIGPGEHLFEQAASIQMRVGPFTVRPDGIRDDREARRYIAQVVGIIRAVEGTTYIGKVLITAITSYHKPVLIIPFFEADADSKLDKGSKNDYAWTYPRLGLFSVVVSFTPLFGQRLRSFVGYDEDEYNKVFTPHETIVHELVHVARAVSCHWRGLGLDEDEEDLATMIANMFSVETNRPANQSYTDNSPIAKDKLAAFSRKSYEDNFDIIEAFCKQNRKLAYDLSYAKTAFNPLRLYIDENV